MSPWLTVFSCRMIKYQSVESRLSEGGAYFSLNVPGGEETEELNTTNLFTPVTSQNFLKQCAAYRASKAIYSVPPACSAAVKLQKRLTSVSAAGRDENQSIVSHSKSHRLRCSFRAGKNLFGIV